MEKSGPNVGENTAGTGAWGRLLVSIGYTEVHDVFAAIMEHGAIAHRILFPPAVTKGRIRRFRLGVTHPVEMLKAREGCRRNSTLSTALDH